MRTILLLTICVFAYVAAGISGAHAQDSWWTLIESTGSVVVHQSAATARNVSLQERLAPGSTLTTGGDGRAVFGRGAQNIAVGPNSRIVLPAANTGGVTRFIQELGTALFNVDKREVEHFEVDTPLIAAVVKGTTFAVSAGAESHAVQVFEGLVQVTPRFGGPVVSVPAGQTAIVTFSNPTIIELVDSDRDADVTFGALTVPKTTSPGQSDGAQTGFVGPVRAATIEEGVSGRFDDRFATVADDRVVRAAEDEVLGEITDGVLATVEDEVLGEITDGVLATIEDEVLGEITDSVLHTIEDEVLDEIVDGVLDTVEDEVLDEIVDGVLDTVEDEVLGEIENGILDTVEDEVLDEIVDGVLDTVEDEVLGEIEDEILDTVEDEVLDEIVDGVLDTVEDEVLGEIEDEVLDEIVDGVLDTVEDDLLGGILGALADEPEGKGDNGISDNISGLT